MAPGDVNVLSIVGRIRVEKVENLESISEPAVLIDMGYARIDRLEKRIRELDAKVGELETEEVRREGENIRLRGELYKAHEMLVEMQGPNPGTRGAHDRDHGRRSRCSPSGDTRPRSVRRPRSSRSHVENLDTENLVAAVRTAGALKRIVGNDAPDEPAGGVELCLRFENGLYVAEVHEIGVVGEAAFATVRGPDLDAVVRRLDKGVSPGEAVLLSEDGCTDLCLTCEGERRVFDDEAQHLVECPTCEGIGAAA